MQQSSHCQQTIKIAVAITKSISKSGGNWSFRVFISPTQEILTSACRTLAIIAHKQLATQTADQPQSVPTNASP